MRSNKDGEFLKQKWNKWDLYFFIVTLAYVVWRAMIFLRRS